MLFGKLFSNSRGGTRTPDPVINSHLLYQLSYSGREWNVARRQGAVKFYCSCLSGFGRMVTTARTTCPTRTSTRRRTGWNPRHRTPRT